jgi:hypothetical protein
VRQQPPPRWEHHESEARIDRAPNTLRRKQHDRNREGPEQNQLPDAEIREIALLPIEHHHADHLSASYSAAAMERSSAATRYGLNTESFIESTRADTTL